VRVLITRAQAEAEAIAAAIEKCGHQAILSPLAKLESMSATWPLEIPDALVFTSRYGPKFANIAKAKCFAIGARTAEAAHNAGYEVIAEAQGEYKNLLAHIIQSGMKNLWHVGGEDVRHDMMADLAPHGITCTHIAVYRMVSIDVLTPAASAAIAAQALDMALIFSPRSAQRAAMLLEETKPWLTAWCMSAAIAVPLQARGWSHIKISSKPDRITLLAEAGLLCDEAQQFLEGSDDDR
jgi:uroporphyrinogen-III synthase